jgi:predicted RNA-binding Zn ribbon-like protein
MDAPRQDLEMALDFVNTLEHSRDHDTEHVPDATALLAWLTDHELLDRSDGSQGAGWSAAHRRSAARYLEPARELRAALRALVDAEVTGSVPRRGPLATINRWLRRRGALRLVRDGRALELVPEETGDGVERAIARLAEAGARGLAAASPGRIKVCANDECRWAFVDGSRAGRRKWCDMASCGNRAKVRRHRERLARDRDSDVTHRYAAERPQAGGAEP